MTRAGVFEALRSSIDPDSTNCFWFPEDRRFPLSGFESASLWEFERGLRCDRPGLLSGWVDSLTGEIPEAESDLRLRCIVSFWILLATTSSR